MLKLLKYQFFLLIFTSFLLGACGGKLPGADARKVSPNPKDRVKKNLEEGRGFRLMGDKKKVDLLILNLQVPMNYGVPH